MHRVTQPHILPAGIVMRLARVVKIGTATCLAIAGPVASWASATAIQSPSHDISCALAGYKGAVLCEVQDPTFAVPPKPSSCRYDYGIAFALTPSGSRGEIACVSSALEGGRVLAYGQRVSAHGITCVSLPRGIRCSNRRGHGFVVSRTNYSLF